MAEKNDKLLSGSALLSLVRRVADSDVNTREFMPIVNQAFKALELRDVNERLERELVDLRMYGATLRRHAEEAEIRACKYMDDRTESQAAYIKLHHQIINLQARLRDAEKGNIDD